MQTLQLPYDPSFHAAVEAGYLTVEEAIHRGDRDVYAAKLNARFDLPRELAYEVADNRRALGQTLQILERDVARIQAQRTRTKRRTGAGLLLCLPLLALALVHSLARLQDHERQVEETLQSLPPRALVAAPTEGPAPEPAPPDAQAQLYFETRRDDLDRLTLVRGPDPRSTTEKFAEATGLTFVAFESGTAGGDGRREARLRDPTNGREAVVSLRREYASGRWVIGDGRRTIIGDSNPESGFSGEPTSQSGKAGLGVAVP